MRKYCKFGYTREETALIAEERDPQDFSSKLIWALQNPEEASKIGKAGALVAMREFNYLNETKKIIDVIKRLS